MAGMLVGISVVTIPPRHQPHGPSADPGTAAFSEKCTQYEEIVCNYSENSWKIQKSHSNFSEYLENTFQILKILRKFIPTSQNNPKIYQNSQNIFNNSFHLLGIFIPNSWNTEKIHC